MAKTDDSTGKTLALLNKGLLRITYISMHLKALLSNKHSVSKHVSVSPGVVKDRRKDIGADQL